MSQAHPVSFRAQSAGPVGGTGNAADAATVAAPAAAEPVVARPPSTIPVRTPQLPEHPVQHHVPEAVTSLLKTIIVALFVLTFVAQPMVIPSESMEHTLLVGDFLLMNRAALAPAGVWRRVLPYDGVERGEIVTFHSPFKPREYLVKRVVGLPGDRLRIDNGQLTINGHKVPEPYVAFEPTTPNPYLDHFPTQVYSDPAVRTGWWKQLQQDTHDGELVIPPGQYFMLGDNRNHSLDSRFWGFVQRNQIVARPLLIYFSLNRPSGTDVQQVADDRLGHESDFLAQVRSFARWDRIFHVVH